MRVLKTMAMRHPKDFSNIILNVNAHRDVIKIFPNGDGNIAVDNVTSEVITVDELKEFLTERFGNLTFCDNYVDPDDGYEVIRGIVIHNGIQKCFIQRYDELTRSVLNDVVKALELTKKVETSL